MGCANKENSNSPQLALNKINSIVLEQGDLLFGKFHEHMKISPDGEYFIFTDRIRNKVFVFTKNGSFHSVLGEGGRGPKGLIQVVGFDVNQNNEVFIFDASQRLMKLFDLEGELLHTVGMFENTPFSVTAFGMEWYDGKVLTSILEDEFLNETHQSNLMAIMNMDGSLDTLFGTHDPFTKVDNQFSFFSEIAYDVRNNELITNLESSPYYQVFDMETLEQVAYGGGPSESYAKPDSDVDMYAPISVKFKKLTDTSGMAHIFFTDRYIIQHMQILTEEWFKTTDQNAKKNILILHDRDTHQFIQEIPIESIIVGAQDNRLYFFEDLNPDNYTIGVYEIIEAE